MLLYRSPLNDQHLFPPLAASVSRADAKQAFLCDTSHPSFLTLNLTEVEGTFFLLVLFCLFVVSGASHPAPAEDTADYGQSVI